MPCVWRTTTKQDAMGNRHPNLPQVQSTNRRIRPHSIPSRYRTPKSNACQIVHGPLVLASCCLRVFYVGRICFLARPFPRMRTWRDSFSRHGTFFDVDFHPNVRTSLLAYSNHFDDIMPRINSGLHLCLTALRVACALGGNNSLW